MVGFGKVFPGLCISNLADDIYTTVVRIPEKSIYTTVLQIDNAQGWDIYTTVV